MKKIQINNELLGIFYMLLAQFSFATNDAIVKVIYLNYNNILVLNQVIFLRGIFALILIGIFLILTKKFDLKLIFSSTKLKLRGLLESVATICFFIGVAKLPFAMVYVLISLAPIFLTAFGALFLNEKVRWKRWSAVFLGFIGLVIVVEPNELKFGYYFIFPLLTAVFITIREIVTKQIEDNFHSEQIAFITCFVVTIFFGILSLFQFFIFDLKEFVLLFISSLFLSFGYFFSVATIKVALVSATSTFRYSVILWGIVYGYFLFNEVPKVNTYIGGLIIVISGLIIITRQKQLGKIK